MTTANDNDNFWLVFKVARNLWLVDTLYRSVLLKHYRGVTIEKRRAAQRTATQSILFHRAICFNIALWKVVTTDPSICTRPKFHEAKSSWWWQKIHKELVLLLKYWYKISIIYFRIVEQTKLSSSFIISTSEIQAWSSILIPLKLITHVTVVTTHDNFYATFKASL